MSGAKISVITSFFFGSAQLRPPFSTQIRKLGGRDCGEPLLILAPFGTGMVFALEVTGIKQLYSQA
jgi:hypothetical protein